LHFSSRIFFLLIIFHQFLSLRLYLLVFSCGCTPWTRNATRARYRSKTYQICLSVLPRFQFSIRLITQTLLLLDCYESLQWPDCTLSPLETWALKNRQVTQSIATQNKTFLFRTDGLVPHGLCYPMWNIDRFHPSCLFSKNIFEPTFGKDVKSQKGWIFTCFIQEDKKIKQGVHLKDVKIYFSLGVDCHPRTT